MLGLVNPNLQPMMFCERYETIVRFRISDIDDENNTATLTPVDGAIYLAGKDGFRKSDLLPADAGKDLHMSFFAEVNGDGYPDVVLSVRKGGLRLLLNTGPGDFQFKEVTAEAGLKEEAAAPDALVTRIEKEIVGDVHYNDRPREVDGKLVNTRQLLEEKLKEAKERYKKNE